MNRFFIKFHRVLGTILSIVFLMWFVSGLVLVYHYFPYIQDRDLISHAPDIDASQLRPLGDILASAKTPADSVATISLQERGGVYELKLTDQNGNEELMDARTAQSLPRFTDSQLRREASHWHDGNLTFRDSLNSIDIWLIWAYPHREWPVLKYSYDGSDRAEAYLSSRTGDVVQFTTRSSRFWSWVGAIPHWIYITYLRENGSGLWREVVAWVSGIGILVALSGLYVGIRSMVVARRSRRHGFTPYAKPLLRWHHIFGLVFGLFVTTYVFSGFMSVRRVPEWIVPVKEKRNAQDDIRGAKTLALSGFATDYRDVIASNGGVRRLTWTLVGGRPVYRIDRADGSQLINAADGRPFDIDEQTCHDIVAKTFGTGTPCTISWQTDYDKYYMNFRKERRPALPVWRIEVGDSDHSLYYLNPADGTARYYNSNTRLRSILYSCLHCFNSSFFLAHPTLRVILIWVLMLGGIVVSLTGVILGARWILRSIRHKV